MWLPWRKQPALSIYYDPAYRIASAELERRFGIETRRADLALWYLVGERVIRSRDVRSPRRASYDEMGLVHTPAYLESISRAETLAHIFAIAPEEVLVDSMLGAVRLAVGATIDAARESVRTRAATLNLLGGFHHAAPTHGGGLCVINDIAVAVAVLRRDGFVGQIAVLDLDAHPPDGTAACLSLDPTVWIGSLSGSRWDGLAGVDETIVEHTTDATYAAALDALLRRMPTVELTFVIAGGDVVAGDRLGTVGISMAAVRARDLTVARQLGGQSSVWLPGGGYSADSWKVLAGTALALARRSDSPITDRDPLSMRFRAIARRLDPGKLGADDELGSTDLDELFGRPKAPTRLLGYYTTEGLEYALHQYGILSYVERLGYAELRVTIEPAPAGGERACLYAKADGVEHRLIDCSLERREIGKLRVLYIHWLNLRNPREQFSKGRPALPGQDAPGLGLIREMNELFLRMAERLGLHGLAFTPAYFHTAYLAKTRFHFLDPHRQGRFEALVRDLQSVPLAEATALVANGQVHEDGRPYQWEADVMVDLFEQAAESSQATTTVKDSVHFNREV